MAQSSIRYSTSSLSLIGALCALGCNAELGGQNSGSSSETGTDQTPNGSDNDDPTTSEQQGTPGAPRLWRLTKSQYRDTTFDLLGVALTSTLPDDPTGAEYSNAADKQSLLPPVIAAYFDAADQLARDAFTTRTEALLPCNPASAANSPCVQEFTGNFGRRVYRRPLEDGEVEQLMALHREVAERSTPEEGVIAIMTAMLMSPKFLFRWEIGTPDADGRRTLTPLETATALAFTFDGRGPNEELLDLAEAGGLATAEQRAEWVRSRLNEEQARGVINQFIAEWLHIDRLPEEARSLSLFPEAVPELFDSLLVEWDLMLASTVWDPAGGLEALLSTTETHVNASTAPLYGVTAPGNGEMTAVTLDAEARHGVLTSAPFLNSHAGFERTIPVELGHFIRHRVLCDEIPPPPANLDVGTLPDIDGATQRERLAAHTEDPSCFACHQFMDDVGLAFENYDPLGRFRTLDQGALIDPSGTLIPMTSGGEPLHFENGVELAELISTDPATYECFATQAFRYVFGRHEHVQDEASLASISESFHATNYSVVELLAALAASDAFVTRNGQ